MSETLLNENELEEIVGGTEEQEKMVGVRESQVYICMKCKTTTRVYEGDAKKCGRCGGNLVVG
ncbi:MAG: hypothetical protein Q4F70_00325 [Clostridia bacterium]|nr:hypothetical protein [Clostridia bacterium]